MTGGQTEEVAACSLRSTRKILLPRCWGACVPHGSLWPGWLSPCLDSQIQAGSALCGQSFPELLWVCVEKGCQRGTEAGWCPVRRRKAAGPAVPSCAWPCLCRQQDLFRVLKAYTLYRPEEGYCQAQAPIAAVLLMHMPAEQAFWCLVQICEKYLPGYYSEKLVNNLSSPSPREEKLSGKVLGIPTVSVLCCGSQKHSTVWDGGLSVASMGHSSALIPGEAIQLDGQILFSLLHKVSPVAYKHLSKQKIDPILYMTEWFMCAFSRTLPWSSVLRVWDMFFCEGVKIIFRVGLVLLKHTLGSSDKLKSCQGQYETMERLRALSPKIMQEAFLVQEVIELPVTERQIEREHLIQLKKWRETHGELQCKSPPRLHGAKAISEAEPAPRKALESVPSIFVSPGPAPVPKARKSKEKSREKGPASPANGPGAKGNGAPGTTRELLQPQASPHHQSKESLSSRESEDTYL
uniref:TBC1 domain family member 10A n=1 Tax=Ficedula albicollis TaxID=59894 RepID=A0A803VIG2_FICAL